MRNNTAIPSEYRVEFPYWIYNTEYPGYSALEESIGLFGPFSQFADWWEKLDNNSVIPPNYFIYGGETFIRTLPSAFSQDLDALTAVTFTVPQETNTITIETEGEWRVTLVQFTSDGTSVGSWVQDGPHEIVGVGSHVFDLSDIPLSNSDIIRLICTNVKLEGTGKSLDEYYQPEAPNGSISIVST